MSYLDKIYTLAADAEQMEQVYQSAAAAGETEAFQKAIVTGHESQPDNLLFAAWYYRLIAAASQAKEYVVAWAWVIPLAVINGLLLWLLADENRFMITIEGFLGRSEDFIPMIFLLAAPVTAVFVLIFLTIVGRKNWRLSALISLILLAATAYVLLIYPRLGIPFLQRQYLSLMVMHLALLTWAGVGLFLLHNHRDPANYFSFLIKSLEAFIFGGLFLIAGVLFTGITVGLFEALTITMPAQIMRLFAAGGLGLVAVIAVAVIYNPALPPARQSFDEGLSKLIALLMRFMLILTLVVLLVYLLFILFNFRAPFETREVLVVYNAMLFAIIALLVGATPVSLTGISPRLAGWLRRGIIAVAALALIISLYALAAIVYRTAVDRLTPNRLTFIGWNVINIGLLFLLLIFQWRAKAGQWLQGLYRAFKAGAIAYAVWTAVVILALPWMFGVEQEIVEDLPL
ncbi:MAG: hypothetical protein R3293_28045, partial [Candidatus Promineifilaceae bacterium]|nr:hypothetical protein [Candidatus Promineifilaceae bacterium]